MSKSNRVESSDSLPPALPDVESSEILSKQNDDEDDNEDDEERARLSAIRSQTLSDLEKLQRLTWTPEVPSKRKAARGGEIKSLTFLSSMT